VYDAAAFAASEEAGPIAGLPEEPEAESTSAAAAAKGRFQRLFSRNPKSLEEGDGTAIPEMRDIPIRSRLLITGLVAASVLVLVAVIAERPRQAPAAAPQAAAPRAAPALVKKAGPQPAKPPQANPIFPARKRAFVTAGIVNCRASPVEQAASVKKLSRGAEVEIIAREADWLSISHKGRQCWAASRYISPDRPA
jgi:hypothetical protein